MTTTGPQRVGSTRPPQSAADARDAVRELLLRQPQPVPERAVTDALLVTSELATNAIRHGGGITACRAAVQDGQMLIVVEDASDALPRDAGATAEMPGGHGWPMVCRLSSTVSVSRLPGGGKRVSASVPLY
ncbi:ATP-binding protein [Streptomyces pactum]|uniref:ATP-binding protein n=1 Tax=Streptomyces pactum TaxID=68249 RepID=A0ABS0NS83_9ACTN|nr:ATP-binding protein [Streptomyces pactum]MBH5338070.1 ATP-binding protein [Streptomyces pactum]